MAKMPRGEPRSTVDPADKRLAEARAKKKAQESGLKSPQELLEDFQNGPPIPRPNLAQSFIPFVGPAWEAAVDLQEGDYAGAAFNTGMAVVDVLPVGVVGKGIRAATKGVGALKEGSVTARAAADALRARGVVPKGYEVHHTIPLNGASRTAQDPRNHYAFLKVLPKEQHRRLTGSWGGKPRYGPVRQIWYGTTDWQKAIPTAAVGEFIDGVENTSKPRR